MIFGRVWWVWDVFFSPFQSPNKATDFLVVQQELKPFWFSFFKYFVTGFCNLVPNILISSLGLTLVNIAFIPFPWEQVSLLLWSLLGELIPSRNEEKSEKWKQMMAKFPGDSEFTLLDSQRDALGLLLWAISLDLCPECQWNIHPLHLLSSAADTRNCCLSPGFSHWIHFWQLGFPRSSLGSGQFSVGLFHVLFLRLLCLKSPHREGKYGEMGNAEVMFFLGKGTEFSPLCRERPGAGWELFKSFWEVPLRQWTGHWVQPWLDASYLSKLL